MFSEKDNYPLMETPFILVPFEDMNDSNRKLTLQEKYKCIEQFLAQGKRKTWICKELNMDVRCYDRIINMTPVERESAFNSKMMLKH